MLAKNSELLDAAHRGPALIQAKIVAVSEFGTRDRIGAHV
jgi:hypothetical protein